MNQDEVLYIDRNVPFDPNFIGNGWSITEQDRRALDITQVILAQIVLEKVFGKDNENKTHYLNDQGYVGLDAMVFLTLWNNHELIPEIWKEKNEGKTNYIFFGGTIVQDSGGHHSALCIYWQNNTWHWGCYCLRDSFVKESFSAIMKI